MEETRKYFDYKLESRDKTYSMIDENSLDIMTKKYKKTTTKHFYFLKKCVIL